MSLQLLYVSAAAICFYSYFTSLQLLYVSAATLCLCSYFMSLQLLYVSAATLCLCSYFMCLQLLCLCSYFMSLQLLNVSAALIPNSKVTFTEMPQIKIKIIILHLWPRFKWCCCDSDMKLSGGLLEIKSTLPWNRVYLTLKMKLGLKSYIS